MADDKKPVIIVKKIVGGHGGAHGGAWKVAYADFVTAMMAFFLVLWLLGSDEEVKSSVAEYFNNPASALRPDLANDKQVPLGDRTGLGDSINRGLDGQVSEDLVKRAERRRNEEQGKSAELDAMAKGLLDENLPPKEIQLGVLKFSVPESALFETGTDQIRKDAQVYLTKLGTWLRSYKGQVTIRGFSGQDPRTSKDDYEFTVSRTVALMKYLIQNKYVDESRIQPKVARASDEKFSYLRAPSSIADKRKIEFTLTQER